MELEGEYLGIRLILKENNDGWSFVKAMGVKPSNLNFTNNLQCQLLYVFLGNVNINSVIMNKLLPANTSASISLIIIAEFSPL